MPVLAILVRRVLGHLGCGGRHVTLAGGRYARDERRGGARRRRGGLLLLAADRELARREALIHPLLTCASQLSDAVAPLGRIRLGQRRVIPDDERALTRTDTRPLAGGGCGGWSGGGWCSDSGQGGSCRSLALPIGGWSDLLLPLPRSLPLLLFLPSDSQDLMEGFGCGSGWWGQSRGRRLRLWHRLRGWWWRLHGNLYDVRHQLIVAIVEEVCEATHASQPAKLTSAQPCECTPATRG